MFPARFWTRFAILIVEGSLAAVPNLHVRRITVKDEKKTSQTSENRQESEIRAVIEKIAANPGGDELLARIFSILSERDREILWGYLLQTDAQELGFALGLEMQSIHNDLKIIREKLGIDTRPELLRRVFSALLAKIKKT